MRVSIDGDSWPIPIQCRRGNGERQNGRARPQNRLHAYAEQLLEESDPCLLCIDWEDEKEARWFKNQIERAIPFWWLHYNPHTVEHAD
jgi:hypothetical protein